MLDLILVGALFGTITYYTITGDKGEFNKIFKASKIQNIDKKVPKVLYEKKQDYGRDVALFLPEGLCLTDIVKKKEPIEQYLGAKIELDSIGKQKVIMRVLSSRLKSIYKYEPIITKGPVELPIGMSIMGPVTLKLDDSYPSCLVGGTSGSGKSVCLRAMITNCILTKNPGMLKLHLCDLKYGVEFSIFKNSNVVETFAKDLDEALDLFYTLEEEMYKRYVQLEKAKVVNIQEYNKKNKQNPIPYHLVFIDEFANMQVSKPAMESVDKLLRMARAVGIHFVIATQRPDMKTVPGNIKANLQATIAFKTRNDVNSMILLDNTKAAGLKGAGHGILQMDKEIEFQGWYLDVDIAKELIKHTNIPKKEKKMVDDTSGVISLDSARTR